MNKFDTLYFKCIFEKKVGKNQNANSKEVSKRIEHELMSYIDQRKEDMSSEDYSKITKMVKNVSHKLNPETIFDELMAIGKVIGLKDSYSRVVGKVVSIADELENEENLKANIIGEPEAEPEVEPEPEADTKELGSGDEEETNSEGEREENLPNKKKKKKDDLDIDMDI